RDLAGQTTERLARRVDDEPGAADVLGPGAVGALHGVLLYLVNARARLGARAWGMRGGPSARGRAGKVLRFRRVSSATVSTGPTAARSRGSRRAGPWSGTGCTSRGPGNRSRGRSGSAAG